MLQAASFKAHSRRLERRHARLERSDPNGLLAPEWRVRTHAGLVDAFFEICDRERITTLIECGAHEAEASVRFIRGGGGRRAIALEANPFTFAELTARAGEQGVEVLQKAVGASPAVGALNIPTSGLGDEALSPFTASLGVNRKWGAKGKVIRSVQVEITTLDEVMADRSTTEQVALWVDVEGCAAEALEGARGLLLNERVLAAIVEVESVGVWSGGRGFDAVAELLARGGLQPVARDHQFSAKTVFNVLFVHRSVKRRIGVIGRNVEVSTERRRTRPSARAPRSWVSSLFASRD